MAPSDGHRLSVEAVSYLINHVVLPPKLPQQDDYEASHEQCLRGAVLSSLRGLQSECADLNANAAITSAIKTITSFHESRDSDGHASELQLRDVFRKLAFGTTDDATPLEIKAQNAGLLISRSSASVVFEPFELSPINKAAMASTGRLIRSLPGSATKMMTQAAPGTQPQIKKNGQLLDEDRDITNPLMVTDWLMNYLAAFGELTDSIRITKHTREDVLWNNCRHPWRRSPLWFLSRVTLQLLFTRRGSVKQPLDGLYKAFMAQMLAHILQMAHEDWRHMGSEVLFIIYTKLARRYRKMEKLGHLDLLRPQWASQIKTKLFDAHALIGDHWKALYNNPDVNISASELLNLRPWNDLDIALPELDTVLVGIASRRLETAHTSFNPSSAYPGFPRDKLPPFLDSSGDYKFIRLAALEAWVEQNLHTWVSTHFRNEDTCGQLRNLMDVYHSLARTAYTGPPVSLSVMYLTILELWVACDRSACAHFPLLSQYSPQVDSEQCHSLVLPLKSQMSRLSAVERYLQYRQHTAVPDTPSIFREFGGPSTFAVRYFDQSGRLQALLSDIKQKAAIEKQKKCEELASLKNRVKDLMNRYNSLDCESHQVVVNHYHGYTETQHKKNCNRCALLKAAEAMSISVYEWPLSSEESIAKATVFELQLPKAFGDWRDASLYLITTVLGCKAEDSGRPVARNILDRHHGLTHMLSPHYRKQRIVPLSSDKPHMGTHRKGPKAIANLGEDTVCLANALTYAYYDKSLDTYTNTYNSTEDMSNKCMFRMPNNRSKVLERFLYKLSAVSDGLPPNEVIASLSDCPEHFSLDEYKSFSMLPFGRHVVYLNILTQLSHPNIDFTKAETYNLLLQIIWQAGEGNGRADRLTHHILADVAFVQPMLDQLETALQRVAENWESWRASAAFVALAHRILSFTSSREIQERCLQFLEEARRLGMIWLKRLKSAINTSSNDKQRSELQSRATEIALLCCSTFDGEDDFIHDVFKQHTALSTFLQCSIVVQENHGSVQSESQFLYHTMLQSWKSFLYRVFTKLRQHILQGKAGLHDAVRANWAAFRPVAAANWETLSKKHEHWLHIKSGSLTVYFNLLTAELLVNGLPLARLPSEFSEHTMYRSLFKNSTIAVVPTDQPGLKFLAKAPYEDYELHFGMEGQDMHVKAIKDSIALDILSSRLFMNRLPFAFANDYIHWYDHQQDSVILRPSADPWSPQDAEWRLVRNGKAWRLFKGEETGICNSSHTARKLAELFSPLENAPHIQMVLNTMTQAVQIHLPRLQLDFSLSEFPTSN